MKRVIIAATILVLSICVGSAGYAGIPKPTANFTGIFETDAAGNLTQDVQVNLVSYLDDSTTNVDTAEETIIGASVNLLNVVYQSTDASGNYLFSDGQFTVTDASGTYMSADLVNVVVSPQGYINLELSLNLRNIVFNTTLNSRFCQEFNSALQQAGITDAGVNFTLDLMMGSFDSVSFGNSAGLIDGAPMVIVVVEPRTIGFWKQQIEQKDNGSEKYTSVEIASLIGSALALDADYAAFGGNVFNNDDALFRNDVTSKGKRDMLIRARQQLGALLLNVVSDRLDETTPISLPEYTTATTVGDALLEVEQKINSGDPVLMEDGKDIADFINNGVGIVQ